MIQHMQNHQYCSYSSLFSFPFSETAELHQWKSGPDTSPRDPPIEF